MIHFDFDDRYQDDSAVGSAISRRESVVLAVVAHVALLALLFFGPRWSIFEKSPEELARLRQARLEEQRKLEPPLRYVFVQPLVDRPVSKAPDWSELSDLNRRAQTREVAPTPQNPLPFSRGNTTERIETANAVRAAGPETPRPEPPKPEPPRPDDAIVRNQPPSDRGVLPRVPDTPRVRQSGALGDALRNLERYVQNQTFNNPQGGKNDPGAEIQFDTKGVDFGPWLRRFVAQVRRNWFVPQAAMVLHGKVVLQFNIHKDGRITDVVVVQPSDVESFNRAAFNAIIGSSPVTPLPAEYPDEKTLFTVMFYYNEQPGP